MHGQNHIKFVKFTFCFLWEFSWRRKDERYETDVQNLYIWFTNHLYTKKNLRQNLALLTSHIRSNSSKDPQALWTQFTASLFIIAWETSPVTRPTRRQRLLRYIWRHFVVSLTPDLKCSRPLTSAAASKGISLHLSTVSSGNVPFVIPYSLSSHATQLIAYACLLMFPKRMPQTLYFWSMLMIILVPLISYFNYYGY